MVARTGSRVQWELTDNRHGVSSEDNGMFWKEELACGNGRTILQIK